MDNALPNQAPSLGSRVRELRMDKGLRQAELAGLLGISPSYLNLIEHDRRRIGPDMLGAIAEALGMEKQDLSAEVDPALVDRLISSASFSQVMPELDKVADLTLRYPGWARLLAAQADKLSQMEARIAELSDRMTHDLTLAASLNDVISAATSIRSTASILNGDDPLDSDWLKRFHKNIHADSIRLASSSDALIAYLESPEEGDIAVSPLQEAEDMLRDRNFVLPELETSRTSIDMFLKSSGLSDAAQTAIRPVLERYQSDAALLPMKTFEALAQAEVYDPARISNKAGVALQAVMRRLTALPLDAGHPAFGLIQVDASGMLGISKHLSGIVFPRNGACPLWPIFTSLGQPGRPIQVQVTLPGTPEALVQCVAVSEQISDGFDQAPIMQAYMLMSPDPAPSAAPAHPIGSTCRVCPREACPARREPAVIQSQVRKLG